MATTTNNTTSAPNDANATSQTIGFIEQQKKALADAKAELSQKQMKLNNATSKQAALSDQYSSAQSAAKMALTNLEEAEKAQLQVQTLTEFFSQRQAVTSQMVDTATVTATKMYEATEFVGQQGVQRVDKILNTVVAYNKTDPDLTTQWTNTFISAVQLASAKGQAALNASVTATKDAFTTLVTTLQIDYRTKSYYQKCQTYQKMIGDLIERLTAEYVMLKVKSDSLSQQLQQVEMSLALLSTDVQSASFKVAQLQAEYTAAQKGASYTGSAISKASSN
ncbi:MAG: hypothetical protein AAGD05_02760 [Bacteroidota bacterium]